MEKQQLQSLNFPRTLPKISNEKKFDFLKINKVLKILENAPQVSNFSDIKVHLNYINFVLLNLNESFTENELIILYVHNLPLSVKNCIPPNNLKSVLEILNLLGDFQSEICIQIELMKMIKKPFNSVENLLTEVLPLYNQLSNNDLKISILFAIIHENVPFYLKSKILSLYKTETASNLYSFLCFNKDLIDSHLSRKGVKTSQNDLIAKNVQEACFRCGIYNHKQKNCHLRKNKKITNKQY